MIWARVLRGSGLFLPPAHLSRDECGHRATGTPVLPFHFLPFAQCSIACLRGKLRLLLDLSSLRNRKVWLAISEAERASNSYQTFDDPNTWHLFDDSKAADTWKAAVKFYEKSLLTAAVRFYTLVNDRSKVIALLSGVGWGNTDYLEEKLEARWGYIEARATKR